MVIEIWGCFRKCSKIKENPTALSGEAAIGHVRYATAGNGSVDNIQPFYSNFMISQIGLAHNGNLTNAQSSLRKELEEDGAIFPF